MKTLIIIRGLSGSGKTTLAKSITPHEVAADDYPGIYDANKKYDRAKQPESHEWCLLRVKEMMKSESTPIAVHNTFAQIKHIHPYVEMAKHYGYQYSVITCEGDYGNVHNVPRSALAKMQAEWQSWGLPGLPKAKTNVGVDPEVPMSRTAAAKFYGLSHSLVMQHAQKRQWEYLEILAAITGFEWEILPNDKIKAVQPLLR